MLSTGANQSEAKRKRYWAGGAFNPAQHLATQAAWRAGLSHVSDAISIKIMCGERQELVPGCVGVNSKSGALAAHQRNLLRARMA